MSDKQTMEQLHILHKKMSSVVYRFNHYDEHVDNVTSKIENLGDDVDSETLYNWKKLRSMAGNKSVELKNEYKQLYSELEAWHKINKLD